MRVLVTGADGFVGQHVVEVLLDRGHAVIGAFHGDSPVMGTLPSEHARRVDWLSFDLRDADSIRGLVEQAAPDALVHLAGVASVSRSWAHPEETFEINTMGTLRLVRALRSLPPATAPRPLLLASSAEVYGTDGTAEDPLTEAHPVRPITPYGASKAAQELAASVLAGGDFGFRLIHTRSCQHLGPGQSPTFVAVDWARQLLDIRDGRREPVLRVGDLDIDRDFLDVRDAAAAFLALLETEEATGAFNICSGRSTSLRRLLDLLQRAAGVRPEVSRDPDRLRPAEIRSLVASHERITRVTGWRPRIPFEETVRAIVASLDTVGRPT